jgi:tetratricopeptide (TPR) repeat protein/tRNA A-37 threonylcarbamoyl transferase component Bud32
MNAWVLDKAQPLGQILADQGQLTPDLRQLLEGMIEKHIQIHQGDPQQSLAAAFSVSSCREDLQQIPDDDVQASLAQVSAERDRPADGTASYHSGGPASEHSKDAVMTGLRYRVLRQHARGGLGEVFVAEDTELHREVALKEIRSEHAGDKDSRGRFVLEAEITGGLEHPGIVPVYGLGSYEDGRPFYAMRFVRGDNLKEAIQRFHQAEVPQRDPGERNVGFRELLGRFVDVCNAVAYAHSRGIVHRDLKPGNVMLGKYGETLVVDWGLAKPVGRPDDLPDTGEATLRPSSGASDVAQTRMGSAVGTPSFMSPEQAAGRLDQLGPAADIYSLGATLYAVLTGTAPFRGKSDEVLPQVQHGDFRAPRQVKATIPAALEAICLKAMALRSADRYRTALALAEDVEHWLADEPVSAWAEPLRLRVGRWARRHKPLVSGAAAALLVGLLALGVGGYWYGQEQTRWLLEVHQSLLKARDIRQKLQDQLGKPGGVFLLLNHPADWDGQLQLARSHLKQARRRFVEGLLEGRRDEEFAELDELLCSDEADYQLAVALDKVRLDKAAWVEGKFNDAGAIREYPKAFQKAGLAVPPAEVNALAGRIQQSPIREQLLAALDDWALAAWFTRQPELVERLLAVARRADPDPWRQQLRTLSVWRNPNQLQELVRSLPQGPKAGPPSGQLSPQLLSLVGELLPAKGKAQEAWLRQAQAAYPADFWLNLQLGYILLSKKKSEAAIGFGRVALTLRPQSTAAHNNLGVALAHEQDYAGAIAHYQQALQLDPKMAVSHLNWGNALKAQQDYGGAITHYQQALQLDPTDAKVHYNWGLALEYNKDYAGAIAHYQQALQRNPRLPNPSLALVHGAWGTALAKSKDYPAAFLRFQKAVTLDPESALPHVHWGLALADQKDYPAAIRHFQQALQLDPSLAHAHFNWGTALAARKDYAAAIRQFQQALTLVPNDAVAHVHWGNVLAAQKDYAQAIRHFQQALQIDPKLAMAHLNWGVALASQKDYPAAIRHYQQAHQFDPNATALHYNWGLALAHLQDHPAAIRHYQQALQIDPNDANLHYSWGNSLIAQKDYAGAVRHYQRAVKLDPNHALAHCNWGNALKAQQDYAGAVHHYQQALQIDPNDAWAHGALGQALLTLGEFTKARQATQQALHLLPPDHPQHGVAQEQLQRCQQLLKVEQRVATLLEGQASPAGPAEQLQLARFCGQYRRYQSATRLYTAALTAQPALAADVVKGHRYHAAAAAALAAAGQGLDAGRLPAQDRAALRRQAQAWLRADLQRFTQIVADLRKGDRPPASPLETLTGQPPKLRPIDRLLVCGRLTQWQADPDLASLRADKALAQLPAEEQTDWHKLWAEVAQLEKQVRRWFTAQRDGRLTDEHKEQSHDLKLHAGKLYVFEVQSSTFAPILRLAEASGKGLAKSNFRGPEGSRHTQLLFAPKQDGSHRLTVASFLNLGRGNYVLRVAEFDHPPATPPRTETDASGK